MKPTFLVTSLLLAAAVASTGCEEKKAPPSAKPTPEDTAPKPQGSAAGGEVQIDESLLPAFGVLPR